MLICSFGGAGMMGVTTWRWSWARSGSVLANHRESPKPGLPTEDPSRLLSPPTGPYRAGQFVYGITEYGAKL
jgi:hypothetical protein